MCLSWYTKSKLYFNNFKDKYIKENRLFQGIPSVEVTNGGRIFASWQTGGNMEPHKENCICLAISDDSGKTFIDPYLIIDHKVDKVRLCNPVLWIDNLNRLWLFYSQANPKETKRMGVWATICSNPDEEVENLKWSKPKRYSDFIIINKPIIINDGSYMYSAQSFADRTKTFTYVSTNNGKSFKRFGKVISLNKASKFSETMMLPHEDKIEIYSRIEGGKDGGMEYSYSTDQGKTWPNFVSNLKPPFNGPGTRFYLRRIDKNSYIFVNNNHPKERTNMTIYYTNDNGKSFSSMLIDDRQYLSYPDGAICKNGDIYLIYDRNRSYEREIIMYKTSIDNLKKNINGSLSIVSKGKAL